MSIATEVAEGRFTAGPTIGERRPDGRSTVVVVEHMWGWRYEWEVIKTDRQEFAALARPVDPDMRPHVATLRQCGGAKTYNEACEYLGRIIFSRYLNNPDVVILDPVVRAAAEAA